jgi:hypothetical protein
MLRKPTLARIQDKKGSINQLREWARVAPGPDQGSNLVLFVANAFEYPKRPRPIYKRIASTILIDGSLGYWEVLGAAQEWDDLGPASPEGFVDALECEVAGTSQYGAVAEVLVSLTANGWGDDV